MNVERIASLHVATSEEDLAFLKQEVIGGRSSHRSAAAAGDGLLYNLAFEDAAANPCEIDAKERPFIGYHPTFNEVLAFVVSPNVELPES